MSEASQGQSRRILGLTGSIGMGKSATAELFVKHGVPVHDSDAAVHRLYEPNGEAVDIIGRAFPGTLRPDRSIDRDKLRKAVLGQSDELKRLEDVIHPLVGQERSRFLDEHADSTLVVLDIPLLFETGADKHCDAVVVVSAPSDVQRSRVLSRPGITEAVFKAILAKQMPDAEKRARADFVIDTSRGFAHAEAEVIAIIARLTDSR